MKQIIRDLTPPLLWRILSKLWSWQVSNNPKYIEWDYIPEGWQAEKTNPNIKGWDVKSILEAYKTNWPIFIRSLGSVFCHSSASLPVWLQY